MLHMQAVMLSGRKLLILGVILRVRYVVVCQSATRKSKVPVFFAALWTNFCRTEILSQATLAVGSVAHRHQIAIVSEKLGSPYKRLH